MLKRRGHDREGLGIRGRDPVIGARVEHHTRAVPQANEDAWACRRAFPSTCHSNQNS
jgi:hypothetical protein